MVKVRRYSPKNIKLNFNYKKKLQIGWVVLILLNMNRNCIDGEESQN